MHGTARWAFLTALVLGLTGCPEAEDEVTGLAMDLSDCLGAIGGDGLCRGGLDEAVAAAPVNACLTVTPIAGGPVGRLPMRWADGRLSEAGGGNLAFAPGAALKASLFFLAEGGSDVSVCQALAPDVECGAGCVLRLHQEEVIAAADGSTTFNFAQGGRCNAQQGPAAATIASETCDGVDNDCDGVVDEAVPEAGMPCTEGVGVCANSGTIECSNGALGCSVSAGEPGIEEAPCNMRDEDCDGVVDENLPCTPCTADADCANNPAGPECVAGLCKVCDPTDHGGCGPDALCCDNACVETGLGTQCEACGVACTTEVNGSPEPNALNCFDRQCRCGEGPGCGGETPFCVADTCVECRGNGDCDDQSLCCGGRCVPTDPAVQCASCGQACDGTEANRCVDRECRCGNGGVCGADNCIVPNACLGDPNSPACDPRQADCADCAADADCGGRQDARACLENRCVECRDDLDRFCQDTPATANAGRRECVGTRCEQCDPRDHAGCAEGSATPICDVDASTCRACANDADCFARPGDLDQCVDGQCVACDPADNDGCAAPTGICDAEDDGVDGEPFTCRACANNADCIAADGTALECVGGLCQGCDPATNAGCDPASGTPICDANSLTCRGCAPADGDVDAECPARPEPADQAVCDAGRCLECAVGEHRGCAEDGATPICVGGACAACDNDAQCALRPGERDQCVAGECVNCDPADNAGCGDPAAPRCDPMTRTCRGCNEDAECNVGGVDGLQCVDGRCEGCDPAGNVGCLLDGDTPICDGGERFCRACAARGECVDAGRQGCVGGRCTECDPATHEGCADTAVCGADGRCRACAANADCADRPGVNDQCVNGECVVCDPTDNRGCGDATPICNDNGGAGVCEACSDNAECARGGDGPECVAGRCQTCSPGDNAGCDANQPICDADAIACRICNDDAECPSECFGGRCVDCDPGAQTGCPANAPFCAFDATCVACANDAQCGLVPGPADQCVGGECVQCDPADSAGCDTAAEPICDGATRTCRGCNADAECGGLQCVGGACVNCDPGTNDGCEAASAAPICNAEFRCVGCANDGECADNPNGEQCVAGACVECDPGTTDGCVEAGATPICDAGSRTCRVCANDAECTIRPGELNRCVDGQCQVCDPSDNGGCDADPTEPICAADGSACRGCQDDECGAGVECLPTGACESCNPANNAGCAGDTPICDAVLLGCRGCTNDGECDGDQCVDGRCEACDPDGHAGCNNNELCCGVVPTCLPTDPAARCLNCNTACNTNAADTCTNRGCACGAEAPCADAAAPFCVNGECGECQDNTNCDADGLTPICDTDGASACRGCMNDGECVGHPRGPECVDGGACQLCDPADNTGCGGATPICEVVDGVAACRGCNADMECAAIGQCVDGACRACDPNDNAGCNDEAPVCDTNDFTCRACSDNPECADNPAGQQCVGGKCSLCTPGSDAGCVDPANPICIGGDLCQPCNADAQCAGKPGEECVDGSCVDCDPLGNAGCDDPATPFCDPGNFTCRACALDAECAGEQCVAGRCHACDDADNAGCINPTPICGDDFQCVGCADDAQCGGGQCVDGSCVDCDPGTNDGCAGDTPICTADGGEIRCVGCSGDDKCTVDPNRQCVSTGACQPCDPGEGANNAGCNDAAAPICGDDFACRGCQNDMECGAQVCVEADGQCRDCDPSDNAGCADLTPFCDAEDFLCRGCEIDAECAGNAAGEQCVGGLCRACNPETQAGCDDEDAPVCDRDRLTCRACNNDGECVAPAGQCVDGEGCRACDPAEGANNAGCNDAAAPICGDDFACRGCQNDLECGAQVCVEADGQCRACDPNDNNAGCDDPAAPFCNADGFVCVECLEDLHCPVRGATCNPMTKTCEGPE